MTSERDLGLETLMEVKNELGIDLDIGLLKACFEIQRKYQFTHDRGFSKEAMERLIEVHLDKVNPNGEVT
jgi:hypothetical protein